MIKAIGNKPDGTKLLILGLSDRNLEILAKDRLPIDIDLEDLGVLPSQRVTSVFIFSGKTEDDMQTIFQKVYDTSNTEDSH